LLWLYQQAHEGEGVETQQLETTKAPGQPEAEGGPMRAYFGWVVIVILLSMESAEAQSRGLFFGERVLQEDGSIEANDPVLFEALARIHPNTPKPRILWVEFLILFPFFSPYQIGSYNGKVFITEQEIIFVVSDKSAEKGYRVTWRKLRSEVVVDMRNSGDLFNLALLVTHVESPTDSFLLDRKYRESLESLQLARHEESKQERTPMR